jgi:predicted CXXCH cytochrome family protein
VTGHAPTAELQAQLFGRTRCAACHADHKGDAGLVRSDSGLCAACHRDLKRRFADTKLGNASDFAKAHPEFRLALWRGPGATTSCGSRRTTRRTWSSGRISSFRTRTT